MRPNMLLESLYTRYQQLAFLRDGAAIVKDPYDLKAVIRLSDTALSLADQEEVQSFAEDLCQDPTALDAIENRHRISADLAELRQLGPRTLGRAYVEHLDRNRITPESLKPGEVTDDFTYVVAHLYETHDIWHAVTGFGTSVAHELGLAAFGAAQTSSKFQYLLLSGGLLNTTFYEFADRDQRMNAIARGWRMGRKAKSLFGVRWDQKWEVPLEKIRADFGIKPMQVKRRAPLTRDGAA